MAPLLSAAPAASQRTVAEELKQLVEILRAAGHLEILGARVAASSGIAEFYEGSAFQPAWTDHGRIDELDRALRGSEADGLEPAHYHVREIERLAAGPSSPEVLAQLDVLRTHGLIRLARDLRLGHTRARGVAEGGTGAREIARLLGSADLHAEVAALRPDHFIYRRLAATLRELRAVAGAGGWPVVPGGASLRRGDVDPRVGVLRGRLAAEGYAAARAGGDAVVFGEGLEAVVRSFQHRHDLTEDGVVGPATLRELNVPVEARIDQLRVNLERARWILHDLPDTFLAVNIPGARVYLLRDRSVVFEARAVVGATQTMTPVFRASLSYIDLNPSWTVPPGIVDEVLGLVRKDRRYLQRNGFRILDRAGRPVDAGRVDFSGFTGRTFPYVFRQEPGPANPLGRVKFVFPNAYNVYLHDTPALELFGREQRTFSHGCIRVENPLRLAELVLDDPARWSAQALAAAVDSGVTRTIPLRTSLPVLVQYWTAAGDLHGELHYHRDVYERDPGLLRELRRP